MFEMVIKEETRTTTVETDDISKLLREMAIKLFPLGSSAPYKLSGARGEIEIGVEGGPQIKIKVL